ncbi:hypothetical protein [uncultured Methylobacterium sp.]|uniref:hypothetical protein n=1 Tax=uncultured Methylobacterium sp. TaxID=157278 RepID=UPI00259413CC|nr:hypothetical protein [uncultured Methylobacterium sp.]
MGIDFFASERAARRSDLENGAVPELHPHLAILVRSVVERTARDGLSPVDAGAPPRDWDRLIAHVRAAADEAEATEAEIRRRQAQARSLLRSAHRRLDEARFHITAAEDRARAAEGRAAALIAAAEERAHQAEDAARSALAWLQRTDRPETAATASPPVLRARRPG